MDDAISAAIISLREARSRVPACSLEVIGCLLGSATDPDRLVGMTTVSYVSPAVKDAFSER
ncbi:hypothetical protein GCM10009533_17690 [Saccharopolyspora spinosporotrichia]|uniref:Uncharacterized protein n=1 Tax=Saccharopolyspora erythraea TaxID=1836 RepID=A0ABN1CGX8_SACER